MEEEDVDVTMGAAELLTVITALVNLLMKCQ